MRFENLSGDPSLDWLARASSEVLAVSLSGALDGPVLSPATLARTEQVLGLRPSGAPGDSSERQRALLAGANRLISGYVEREGDRIRIAATEENLSNGKSLRMVSVSDSSPVVALDRLARRFSANPRAAPSASIDALRFYAKALEDPLDTGVEDLHRALAADPNFGEAWVGLANLEAARGDRAAADEVIAQARQRKLDPLSLARLNLDAANLQPGQLARIDALRKVVDLSPGDTTLLRDLAQQETTAGRFEAAAATWKKMTVALPDDPAGWNSLGYSLAYAGDYNGALAALQQYARMRPKDPNPADSIGDVQYWFRKFREAGDSYQRAHDLQPAFQQYGDLYKAAWARFNAGDKSSAGKLFSEFRAEREKIGEALTPLLAADWSYRTGDKSAAFDSLRKTAAETGNETVRSSAYAQLTIWELIGRDRETAARDSLSIGPRLTEAPMLIARFAALPSAPAAEWEARAEHLIPPSMAGLRPLALGYALLLDGKREAALPVWELIAKATPATDFFSRDIYARLQGKTVEHPLLPDPQNYNQFRAVLDAL